MLAAIGTFVSVVSTVQGFVGAADISGRNQVKVQQLKNQAERDYQQFAKQMLSLQNVTYKASLDAAKTQLDTLEAAFVKYQDKTQRFLDKMNAQTNALKTKLASSVVAINKNYAETTQLMAKTQSASLAQFLSKSETFMMSEMGFFLLSSINNSYLIGLEELRKSETRSLEAIKQLTPQDVDINTAVRDMNTAFQEITKGANETLRSVNAKRPVPVGRSLMAPAPMGMKMSIPPPSASAIQAPTASLSEEDYDHFMTVVGFHRALEAALKEKKKSFVGRV